MRKLKKVTALLISAVMVFGALVGCSAPAETESTVDEISAEATTEAEKSELPYELSDITVDYLASLDKNVDLYFLMELDELRSENDIEELVNLLDSYSSFEQVNLTDFSPDENPEIIEQLDPEGIYNLSLGDIVLKCEDNVIYLNASGMYTNVIDDNGNIKEEQFHGESLITGAIKSVAEGIAPVVYFVTGHGEKAIDTDYTNLAKNLMRYNYIPMQLDLSSAESVPEDAAIVVIAAPQSDISSDERSKLEKYMDRGGNLSLLMPPSSKQEYANISAIMEQYGLEMNYDTVLETQPENCIGNERSTIAVKLVKPDPEADDLTSALTEASVTPYISASRSVDLIEAADASDLIVCPLIETYDTAVSKPCGAAENSSENVSGKHYLAAYSHNIAGNGSKLVFMGNAEFIDDEHVTEDYNMISVMLYMCTVSWMKDSTIDMGIPTKAIN